MPYTKSREMTVVVWARSTKPKWTNNAVLAADRQKSGFILHADKGSGTVGFYVLEGKGLGC